MAILIIVPLQISQHPGNSPGPRVAAIAQIEDETRIPDGVSAESGRRRVILAKKFFYLSEQMHLSYPYNLMRLGCSLIPNAFPTCLGTYLSLKGH